MARLPHYIKMKKTEAQAIGDIIHEVFVRSGMEGNEARQKACMV